MDNNHTKQRPILKFANNGIEILNHSIKHQFQFNRLLLVAVLVLSPALFFLARPDFSYGNNNSGLKGEGFVKIYILTYNGGDIDKIFNHMYISLSESPQQEIQLPEGMGEEMGQMMQGMAQMLSQGMGGMIKQMLAMTVPNFNQGNIIAITPLNRQQQGPGQGGTKEKFIHHVLFDSQRAVTAHTEIINLENGPKVLNFNYIVNSPISIDEMNGFFLGGKSIYQYVFLFLTVISTLFCLAMLVLCLISDVSKKWLWLPLILVSVGNITIPWVSGNYTFTEIMQLIPLHIQIFPMGFWKVGDQPLAYSIISPFWKADFEPWVLSLTLPLGAIFFLFKYIFGR